MLKKLLVVTALVVVASFAWVSPALAGPVINYTKVTNPIAYDLRSFQSTRFYTSVGTAGVWAKLVVKTSTADVVLYNGSIPNANQNFYFPLWNGKRSDGSRLPSATYT